MQTIKEMIQQIQRITYDAYKSSGQAAALLKAQGGPPEAMAKALKRTATQMEQGTVELRGPGRKFCVKRDKHQSREWEQIKGLPWLGTVGVNQA